MAAAVNSQAADKATSVTRPSEKGKLANFCGFLYDRQTGAVLGRTGKSWLEITVFYIIFYSCLAGFFAINLSIFLETLDKKLPRYYGKGSIIGVNPGLGYQPWIKADAESTLIRFDPADSSTYSKYVEVLDVFWSRYNASAPGLRHCSGTESNSNSSDLACSFPLDQFEKDGCGPPDYGFKNGTPCIVLTLNKLISWEPMAFPDNSLPKEIPPQVKENYKGDVAVACEGEYFADQENIGQLSYIPPSGISSKFFPFKVMETYHQPFAMVKFLGLQVGVLVEVECKAYAMNIEHDRTNRLGMIHFEMYRLPEKKKTIETKPNNTLQA